MARSWQDTNLGKILPRYYQYLAKIIQSNCHTCQNLAKGRTIIFLEGGMDISSTQTIFFGVVVVANNFFAPASFCKQFFLSI